MEKTIDRKVKNKFAIHISDFICAGIAMLFGGIASVTGIAFTFIYLSCTYLRSTRETCISIFFILLCSLARGLLPAYFYALGFALFFVIIHLLKLKSCNLYRWMPYLTSISVAAYSVQAYGINVKALVLPLMTWIILQQIFSDYAWIQKEAWMPSQIRAILLLALALGCSQLFPIYQEVFLLIALLNIVYLSDVKTSIALLLMSTLLLTIDRDYLLLLAGVLAVFKDQKGTTLCILTTALLFLVHDFEDLLYLVISAISFVIMTRHTTGNVCVQEPLPSQNIVKRQMNNYAGIFQLLADYYAQFNDVQAELLSNMSSALQYNADIIRKVEGNEKDSTYIRHSLEGYQYNVHELTIDEPKEGCIQIELEISNIKRGEIRMTLLPLMEVLLHRKLQVEELHSHRFMNGVHRITFVDQIPYTIDAYADSVKNSYTSNGDTFSIFRFRQSVVCMICDGMGNGERAMKSSRLITSIFQRMMICGIAQDNAIRCINKLVQSDTFATLDVLCFNRAQGMVYISKSAACPTYLLRDGNIYEINGNALPVGIISQMQPDCFQMEYQAGDEYLMVSDGVDQKELQEWLKKRRGNQVKEDVEIFADILRSTRRMDDSTIILAKVDEITQK